MARRFPDYDTPVKINMEFEEALTLLLSMDVATSDVEISQPMLQPEDVWRRIDNCDGDPEVLYAQWDSLMARREFVTQKRVTTN